MLQPNHQLVVDEALELNERVCSLQNFIEHNKTFLDFDADDQMLLEEQLGYMKGYLDVLNERIARF